MIAIWIMSCTGQVAECVGSSGWCGSSSSSVGLHQCSWRGFPQPLLPVVHRPAARGLICHVLTVVVYLFILQFLPFVDKFKKISKLFRRPIQNKLSKIFRRQNPKYFVAKSKIFRRQIQNISSTNPKYFVNKSKYFVDKSKKNRQ